MSSNFVAFCGLHINGPTRCGPVMIDRLLRSFTRGRPVFLAFGARAGSRSLFYVNCTNLSDAPGNDGNFAIRIKAVNSMFGRIGKIDCA